MEMECIRENVAMMKAMVWRDPQKPERYIITGRWKNEYKKNNNP